MTLTETTVPFTEGDTVYLESGATYQYVSQYSEGHVVRAFIRHEDDEEPYLGRACVVPRVFRLPPREVFEEGIAKLIKTEEEIMERLKVARQQDAELAARARERAERFKQHAALNRIDDFIQGKLTHYVIKSEYGGRIRISTPKEEKCGDEKFSSDIKLLALFGKSNGNLEWKLSRYSDFSGNQNSEVWLCQSREEAMKIAVELIEATYASYREKPQASCYVKGTAESAKALGLTVPDDILRMIAADEIRNIQLEIEKYHKGLATQEAKLAALKQPEARP